MRIVELRVEEDVRSQNVVVACFGVLVVMECA